MNFDIAPWRVKVYELEHEEWQDRGTGYCSGEIMGDEAYIIVVNEDDKRLMILTSRIKGDMQYQKQQETLIVWTEANKNDMALSFQEAEGCSMICDFLVWVQQKYEHTITIMATIPSANGEADMTEIIAGPIAYPPEPKLGNLEEVTGAMQTCISAQFSHEAIVKFIHEEDYIGKLVKLFYTAEDLQSLEDLHHLCRIIKMLCKSMVGLFRIAANQYS
jgi:protein phosphatase 4 regulatory subunit 3